MSDELAAIIKTLAGNEDKIRVVLNKADQARALFLLLHATYYSPLRRSADLAAAPHARVRRAHVVARQGQAPSERESARWGAVCVLRPRRMLALLRSSPLFSALLRPALPAR